ncbi:MAG: WYL domain-containing protein [Lentisphaerae bacterium]|nr:WYL domain-containing protein [Lentisphaerota bacterium]
MNRTKSQFWRLQQLVAAIRSGKHPNCLSFAMEYEVSQKTVQRDIDYLRDAWDAPIAYDRLKNGFYFTEPNWFLPAVMMSEGDFLALLLAARVLEQYHGTPVAAELNKIIGKLTDMLPDKISLRPEWMFTRFSFTAPPSKPVNEAVWSGVVRATIQQKWLNIKYRSFNDKQAKSRVIAPYHVANLQGEWYVFGPEAESTLVRQWSMARIGKAELTDNTFSVQSDFDARQFLASTFGRYAGAGKKPYHVRLRFKKEVADWITEREWHPGQKVSWTASGDLELNFTAAGLLELRRWVLAWGGNVKVLAPPELRQLVSDEIKGMAKIY